MLMTKFPGSPKLYAAKEWPPASAETLTEAARAQARDEAS